MGRRSKRAISSSATLAKYLAGVKLRKAVTEIECNLSRRSGGETPSLLFPLSIIPLSSNPSTTITTESFPEETPTTTTQPESKVSWNNSSTTAPCLICGGDEHPVSQIPSSHSKTVATALIQLLLLRSVRGCCNETEKQDIVAGLETSWYCSACLEELKSNEVLIDQFEKCNVALWVKRTAMIQRLTRRAVDNGENVQKENQTLQLRNKLIRKLQAVEGSQRKTKTKESNVNKKKQKENLSSKGLLKNAYHGVEQSQADLADGGGRCLRKSPSLLRSKILKAKVTGAGAKKMGIGGKKRKGRPRKLQIHAKSSEKGSVQFVLECHEEGQDQQTTSSFLEEEQEMDQASFDIKREEEEDWEIKDVAVDPLQLESSPADNNKDDDNLLCTSYQVPGIADDGVVGVTLGFEETNSTATAPPPQTNQITTTLTEAAETDLTFNVIGSQMIKAYHNINKTKPSLSTATSSIPKSKKKKNVIKIQQQPAAKSPPQIALPKREPQPPAPPKSSGQCSECGQFFQNVKHHQLLSHGVRARSRRPRPTIYVDCSVCGKCLSQASLPYHMLSMHGTTHEQAPSNTRAWGKCNECGKFVFNLADHLSLGATTWRLE